MFSFKEEPYFPSLNRTSSEQSSFPTLSRSSSEQSNGSTGNGFCSKSMFTAPSLQLQESLTKNLLWGEAKVKDELDYGLDTDSDPPLWDMDTKDPACEWNYDQDQLTNQLAEKLLIEETERAEYSNPLLSQSDIINPFMMMNQEKNIQQLNATIDTAGLSNNPRFKTEICRNYKEKGTCLYGELCQFAHGKHELRKDVVRHNKYKTKFCQKYWIHGYCAYGPRCNFIHQDKEANNQGGTMTSAGADSLQKTAPLAPTIWQCKSVEQVLGLANARKANVGDQGDNSGSEEGRMYGSMMGGQVQAQREQRERMINMQLAVAKARQEEQLLMADRFPTFYPRSYPAQVQGGNLNQGHQGGNLNHTVGPVGSGRPPMDRPQGPQRVVWPGA